MAVELRGIHSRNFNPKRAHELADFLVDTTRAPRSQEQDGKDYYFTTREKFEGLIKQGGFIEHAQFGSNLYGTSFKAVEAIEEAGKVCILDIEMEVCYIFFLSLTSHTPPPSPS
jgi:guanylate kinase